MQVHRIQSNQRTFGYNEEANMKLLQMLAKQRRYKDICCDLARDCEKIMRLENNLRKAETDKKSSDDYCWLLTNLLVPMKLNFTTMIDKIFPKLNYLQEESKEYASEAQELNLAEEFPEHWINVISYLLKDAAATKQKKQIVNEVQGYLSDTYPEDNFEFQFEGNSVKARFANNGSVELQKSEETNKSNDDKSLAESIEIGRNAVVRYKPTTNDELMGFGSLSGNNKLQKQLTEDIIYPLKNPELAELDNIEYPMGIILYGPPGTGKTTIVRRLATEAGITLLEVRRDSIASTYRDGSEVLLKAIFDYARSIATKETPVLLLFDDIDTSIASRNEGGMAQHHKGELNILFNMFAEAHKDYIIPIATTNEYDQLDGAIKSRFSESSYYVDLPDKDARISFIKTNLMKAEVGFNLSQDTKALNKIGELTDNFDYRALKGFIKRTKNAAVHDKKSPRRNITLEDFEAVIADSQELKNERDYKPDAKRVSVGFNINT